jgi:hypothetical protein
VRQVIRDIRNDHPLRLAIGLGLALLVGLQIWAVVNSRRVDRSITATCPQVARSYTVTVKLMQRATPPFTVDEIGAYLAQRDARLHALGCS